MNRIGLFSTLLVASLALPAASGAKDGKKTPQVELVRKLYRNFAWEAVLFPEPGETLAEQPRGVLKDYFEGSLASLLADDAACARKGSVCRLDVDPLFGTRDPVVHDLEVLPTDSAGVVLVRFASVDGGSETMTEIVVRMAGSGRIGDMVYPKGPSLRTRLASPPPE